MRALLLLFVAASCVVGHPQYSGPVDDHNQGNHPPTQIGDDFTGASSCGQGSDCVPFYKCVNGVIDTSGSGQLDLRQGGVKTPVPSEYQECEVAGSVCCKIPADSLPVTGGGDYGPVPLPGIPPNGHPVPPLPGIPPNGHPVPPHPVPVPHGPPYPSCSAGLLCVLEDTCNLYTGFIGDKIPVFEGQPFIEYSHCTTEYISVGVCCQETPGVNDPYEPPIEEPTVPYVPDLVVFTCLANEDCVPPIQCHNGVINTDGSGLLDLRKKPDYTACVDPSYPSSPGVCCRLPDVPDPVSACPDYSICTDRMYCDINGFIVPDPYESPAYGDGLDCFTNPGISYNVGVCCTPAPPPPPPTVDCPITSVCIPSDFCFGDVLESSGSFSPYVAGDFWPQCSLPGVDPDYGVCCSNPEPPLPVSEKCGVSQYGSQDDSLKTRKYVPHLEKREADFGELPWQAIVFFSNYTFKCGATLISDRHLLTVAHCVNGLYPSDLRIRVGEWQVNTFTEPLPYQDIDVVAITVHPAYKPGPHWNNIAIIELQTPVELKYNVNNVCLPFGGTFFAPGTRCLVSGWGKDSFEGTYQHILKKIDVPLIDHHQCQDLLRYTRLGKYFRLHDSYLCAGGEEGQDACVGDGGGPLICFDDLAQSYVQVGITAWGIGCGEKDVPGAYTDISKFIPWIGEVTGLGGDGGGGGGGAYGK